MLAMRFVRLILFFFLISLGFFAPKSILAQTAEINPTDGVVAFEGAGVGSASVTIPVFIFRTSILTDVNITSVSLGDTINYSMEDTCTGKTLELLPASDSFCVVNLQFNPTAIGSFPTSLTIVTDATNMFGSATPGEFVFDLSGTGIVGPSVAIVPNPVSFGMQVVDSTSLVQIVALRSNGTTSLENIVVTGLTAGTDFEIIQDNCNGQSLPVGGSCLIQAVFAPTVDGALVDSFDISADGGIGPITVDLDGTGIQSGVTSAGSGSFGSVNVGDLGGPNSFTITNTSVDADLWIGNLQQIGNDTNQFSVRNDNCSNQTILPGDDCAFEAVFSPHTAGAFTDTVLIPNNSDTPNFSVSLSGTGIAVGSAQAQIKPDVLDFDVELGESNTQGAVLTNIGSEDLTITDLMLTADANFSASDDCIGVSLGAGETCSITVVFAGGQTAGNFSGTIMVVSNSVQQTFLVLLGSTFSDDSGNGGSGGCAIQAGPVDGAKAWCLALGLLLAFGLWRLQALRKN